MINFLFLFGFLISLGISGFCIFNYSKHNRDEKIKKIVLYFGLIGVLYLILVVFSFLWALEIVSYLEGDFLFIFCSIIFLQGLFLFGAIYQFISNKKLFFFFIFYIIFFICIFFLESIFLNIFLIFSNLFFIFLFFSLLFRKDAYSKSGRLGIIYSIVSILLQLFNIFLGSNLFLTYILGAVLFFVFIFYFFVVLKDNPPLQNKYEEKERHYFFVFLNHFAFMLIFVCFIFISTVVIHEFGHLTSSNFYDCESSKIVYQNEFPHTEILCGAEINQDLILAAGIIFPLIIALILFLIGGKFLREISALILGFDLIISYQDLIDLGLSDNITLFATFIGICLVLFGIILLAKSKTEEQLYGIT